MKKNKVVIVGGGSTWTPGLLKSSVSYTHLLPEFCKPCLFLSSIQFAQFIGPYRTHFQQN